MNNLNENNKKFATGWIIVMACMLIQAVPFGIASNIQPLFVGYVVKDKGFSLSGFSLIFTIGTIISALAAPFIGMLFNKINTKTMFLVGCILAGGGFFSFGFAQELWQFYILSGLVNIGAATISSIGVPLLLNRWFDELSKGKALGLAFAGASIGNIFLQGTTAVSLANYGASKSYFIFGLISLIIGIPVSLLVLRMPKDNSEIVVGIKNKKNNISSNSLSIDWSYTLKELKNIKFFWIFVAGLFFLGMYISALTIQFPSYLSLHVKFDPVFVGIVGSLFALFSLFGNILGGILFDKLGVVKSLVIGFILAIASIITLLLSDQGEIFAQISAALKGLAAFTYMMGPSLLVGSMFGKQEFGTILGVTQIFFAGGFAIGSSIFGLLVDNISFNFAWYATVIFTIACYVLLIIAYLGMSRLNKERISKLQESQSSKISYS